MKTVTVDTKELIATIEKNLETHKADFEEAKKGYAIDQRAALVKTLDHFDQFGQMPSNSDPFGRDIGVILPKPRSYEADYQKALTMLRMSVNQTQELDVKEFEELVMDKWQWKDQFVGLSAAYSKKIG